MDLEDIIKSINDINNYMKDLTFVANKLDKIFDLMLTQFNSINIKCMKLIIQDRFILSFPEDFEDQKLFNGFRQLFDGDTKSVSLSVLDAMNDRNLMIMIIDNMYQNIQRLHEVQFRAGKWPTAEQKSGTD